MYKLDENICGLDHRFSSPLAHVNQNKTTHRAMETKSSLVQMRIKKNASTIESSHTKNNC